MLRANIHAVCWADSDPRVKYYSAAFDGTVGDYAVWMPAFQRFLEQKFRFTGFDRCTKKPTLADAQKYLQDMINSSRSMKLGDGSSPKVDRDRLEIPVRGCGQSWLPRAKCLEIPDSLTLRETGVESLRFSKLKMEIAVKRICEWRSKFRPQLDGSPKGVLR